MQPQPQQSATTIHAVTFWDDYYKTHLIPLSTDAEDAKMLLEIPSTMNNVLNDQIPLNLVDVCLDS